MGRQWPHDGDSDSSSDLYSDPSDEDEEITLKRKGHEQQSSKFNQIGGAESCRLDTHLNFLYENFPRSHLLLTAHLQIEKLHSNTQWTLVWQALQAFGPEARQPIQGDEKTFKRLNTGTSFPVDHWAASVKRFIDFLEQSLSILKKQDNFHSYSNLLSPTQRKSFSACVQVWRKTLQKHELHLENVISHRLLTSIDASVLCRRDEKPRMVICFTGHNIDLYKLQQDLIANFNRSKNHKGWQALEICADTSLQVRNILEVTLGVYNNFQTILLCKHGNGHNKESKGRIALPAILLNSSTVKVVQNNVEKDDAQESLSEADYRQVIDQLAKKNIFHGDFVQASKMPKLSDMSSLVARLHGLDLFGLPEHLQQTAKTASRCISCTRIVINRRPSSVKSLSSNFLRQASLAGFKVPRHIIEETVTALSIGSSYLPPLQEYFGNVETNGRRVSIVLIGGASSAPLLHSQSGTIAKIADWQFCAACAALHLGLQRSTNQHFCRCLVCTNERHRQNDPSYPQRWRRYNQKAKQESHSKIRSVPKPNV